MEVLVVKTLLNLVLITKNNSVQVLMILIQKLKAQHHLRLRVLRNQKLKKNLIQIQKKIHLTQILTLIVTIHKKKRKNRKRNRKKKLKNKKKLKKKKTFKYLLLMVCQWHRKPKELSSLPSQLHKSLFLRQLLQRTFSIYSEDNRHHKQVTKMDSVLWTKNQPNKMDLVLWIRNNLNKILLLLLINRLTIQIWINQVPSVDQVYLITWTCKLNQLHLYLLAMEGETCSQDCQCQVNKQSNHNFSSNNNLNNFSSNNNLNNLISNSNNHQPKNHLYGMTISLASFLTFLAHLWTNQLVKTNLLSPIFFQSCNQ